MHFSLSLSLLSVRQSFIILFSPFYHIILSIYSTRYYSRLQSVCVAENWPWVSPPRLCSLRHTRHTPTRSSRTLTESWTCETLFPCWLHHWLWMCMSCRMDSVPRSPSQRSKHSSCPQRHSEEDWRWMKSERNEACHVSIWLSCPGEMPSCCPRRFCARDRVSGRREMAENDRILVITNHSIICYFFSTQMYMYMVYLICIFMMLKCSFHPSDLDELVRNTVTAGVTTHSHIYQF